MPSAARKSNPSTSNSDRNAASNSSSSKWIETFLGEDGTPTNTTKQIVLGGVSGWVTGFMAMKVGKAAATAIGGGIILLQIANHQGYININWSRLQRDVNNVATRIAEEGDQKKKDWTAKLEKKIDRLADKADDMAGRLERRTRTWYDKLMGRESRDLHLFFSSFAVGTFLGVITGS